MSGEVPADPSGGEQTDPNADLWGHAPDERFVDPRVGEFWTYADELTWRNGCGPENYYCYEDCRRAAVEELEEHRGGATDA